MRQDIELRVVSIAHAMVFSGATVRALAREYGVSKSTVHKDVAKRLRTLDPDLYAQVQAILIKNKSERHIRGGMATKLKYKLRRQRRADALKNQSPACNQR